MDLILTEEQRILFDTVSRLGADIAGFDPAARRARLAEFGLTALGLDADEPMIAEGVLVAEALGQARVNEAYVHTHLGAARALAGQPAAAALASEIAAGTAILAPALHEPGRRYDLTPALTTLQNGRLDGRKVAVMGGDVASHALVSARDDHEQLVLVVLPLAAPGVTRRPFATLDGRGGAELALDGATEGAVLASGPAAERLLADMVARIDAGLVADSVGAMSALMAMTAEYLRTRRQFGKSIGAFQALQHRFVDMKLAHELARSMAIASARALEMLEGPERDRVLASARLQAADSGRRIGEEAIQMHGAMGMTAEYPAGGFFKRLLVNAASFGDADHQLDRLIALARPGANRSAAA
ncbi:MAG: hypothetical protein H6900_16740 [Rhodobacter sp.]|uniref:acyl-CoA dehydrogenase family protein n=1 Tax=Pararhodobacter sp. TaxID=2127056 RepID=UPI001DCCA25F|nr:acyl-CoA dehydrogenase [Pararhodobacter sp.]MCB1343883.1 hypothetical protein [Paracoccaceae bacterium]MCC0074926.1 hypothetical protein [Rhodobacter sp.]HPD91370.1 acyl-CoA dehydrogenase [Pararhodobacter sp.]